VLVNHYQFTVTGADTKEVRQRWWDLFFFVIGVVVIAVSLAMLVKKYMANTGFRWTDIKYIVFMILAANAGFQFFNKQQLSKRLLFAVSDSEIIFWDAVAKVQQTVRLTDVQNSRVTYDEVLLITLHSGTKHEVATEQWSASKKAALKELLKTQQTTVA
jgi:hypothetical protein